MCDGVACGARRVHELLDAVEHGVDGLRQFVELIARATNRRTARQIAGHDFTRRGREGFGPARGLGGREQAARNGNNDADDRDSPKDARDPAGDDGAVAEIARNQENRPVDEAPDAPASATANRAARTGVRPLKTKVDALRRFGGRDRQLLEISGDDCAAALGEHIKEGPLPRGAFNHFLIEPAHAAFSVSAFEGGVLLVGERVRVADQLADGGEIDVSQHDADEQQHHPGLHQSKPECCRAKERVEAWPHPSSR